LERIVDVIDEFDSSRSLALRVVENNFLHEYEKTCGYLGAVGDVDTLVRYVRILQSRFYDDDRWEFFSRKFVDTVGSAAALLKAQGLVGPVDQPCGPLQLGMTATRVDLDR
jgi:hypothetical protein